MRLAGKKLQNGQINKNFEGIWRDRNDLEDETGECLACLVSKEEEAKFFLVIFEAEMDGWV